MTRLPMNQRLILIGTVIVAACIAATGLIIQAERTAAIDAFQTATINLGNGMARQTTQAISAVDQILRDVRTDLDAVAAGSKGGVASELNSKRMFDRLVDQRKRAAGIVSLALVDAEGQMVNSSAGWKSAATDVSGRAFFRHFKTVHDDTAFVDAPVQDAATGKWTVTIARPMQDASGGFEGVVVAEISLATLEDFYRMAMPVQRSVYILRSDGVVLVRYPAREEEIGEKIPAWSPWIPLLAKGGAWHGPGFFDQTRVIASVNPLRNLPLVLVASVLEADALAGWDRQALWIACGAIATIVGVVTLLRLFARQYQRLESSELLLVRKNAELDAAHRQLDETIANLSQGICFFDEAGKLLVFNQQYAKLYNLPVGALRIGMSSREVAALRSASGSFSDEATQGYLATVESVIRRGQPHDLVTELADGRTISIHFEPLPGRGWVMTHEDITQRCEAESRISFLARHDVLTGLANRALFYERLGQAVVEAKRGNGFAVMCLDLDGFKAVNDTYGHPVGDELLRAVADRLQKIVREGDLVARLGGDEFAVILSGASEAARATALARRVVQALNEPFDLVGCSVGIGVSIGIATTRGDSLEPGQLMKDADLALYRSKQEGRGTWRFFEPQMDVFAKGRRALEIDLRNAVSSGQLELHYQPFVSGNDRSLSGFEALLRWRHPERGLIMPVDFIPIAEESGLIVEIGAWVLMEACKAASSWPEHTRIAVNLSARQFRDRELRNTVSAALVSSGISPARLELEITESLPLLRDEATRALLRALRELGCRIALDDFGTGYSSLSYLSSFPFDRLKIDKSFVNDLAASGNGVGIVRGIVSLATNLGMKVTAEGVETEAQFELLAGEGCTDIQGYLISKPLPGNELGAIIDPALGKPAHEPAPPPRSPSAWPMHPPPIHAVRTAEEAG